MRSLGRIPPVRALVPPEAEPRGFALPSAMLTLLLVSLMAAGGFFVTWIDGQSARAFARSTEAFYVAESGLATALALAEMPNPSVPPVTLGAGTATVSFEHLLELRPGEAVYRVESLGRVVYGDATFERSVGQLLWVAGPPRVPGALVLMGSTGAVPPKGTITGLDAFGSACPQQPSPVAGVAYWGGPPPAPDSLLTISGSPADRRMSADVSVTAETGIRWTELLASWSPRPDAVVPSDPWPSPGADSSYTRISGSGTLGAGSSGRGALVVEGDLTLDDGFAWRGLILVGGALLLNGDISVHGSVASGLAGGAGVAADFGGHRIDLRFSACAVATAAERLTAPAAAIPGTWYEVW
ncbi:MAG: pilus assembly PilX N-terminal domain-containing protein [Gemmatimonadetes bacterium]|nr:pilus assembly PilX N-terminal domain-containing protein [Candidatus Palauibacter australiensis]